MNRIAFYTFGCRLNQSETSTLERNFESNGYKIVALNEQPDIVVVNTCTVTENGDADTHRLVNKINRINPKAHIALVGCQAQIQKGELAKLQNVRWVVGNARKMELASIIQELDSHRGPHVVTPPILRKSFTIPSNSIPRMNRGRTRANLKIQDGCDFFCSFCEIPFARGRARSRVFEDILLEANALVVAGHKELVITGVNLGTYAHDKKTLLNVIEDLEKIDGLERIRISSIEPTTIPFELIERMGVTKLCRHLHIPLQSASDEILKMMQRKYMKKEFSDFILHAYKAVPQIAIGTDVIVGFPGETDQHFNETAEFLKNMPFSYIHVFSYSDRTLNKSRTFPEKIPIKTIQKRSQILRDLSCRKRLLFIQNLIGTAQDVLFEEKKNGYWVGWSDNYVKIKVQTQHSLQNQNCRIIIKNMAGLGEIV